MDATSKHEGVTPPTNLFVFFVVYLAFPGSTLSGEKAKKKSSPTLSPDLAKIGSMTSSVVPG